MQQTTPVEEVINVEEDKRKYFQFVEQNSEEHNNSSHELIKKYIGEGEYVYELFSILNHTGGAMGGHYYAFIKSFEDGRWYCFNDGNVTGVEADELPKKAFGGQTNNSAYMLFYRKVEKEAEKHSCWGGSFCE